MPDIIAAAPILCHLSAPQTRLVVGQTSPHVQINRSDMGLKRAIIQFGISHQEPSGQLFLAR